MEPMYNREAEQYTIGSCLIGGPIAIREAQERLISEDFYEARHQLIWEAVCRTVDANKPVDILAIETELGKDLDKIGGRSYLIELAQKVPSFNNIGFYAQTVKRKAVARIKRQKCLETIKRLEDDEDPYEVISQGMIVDSALIGSNHKSEIVHVKEKTMQVYEEIGERRDNHGIVGQATGFSDLDYRIGGLRKGNLHILAARPSMGKTTLALNIAKYVAFKMKVPTLFVSLEMTNDQLIEKMLAEDAGIESNMLQNTTLLKDSDWRRLSEAANNLCQSQLYLDDSHRIKASDLAIRLRRFKALHDLGFVIIDYIQIMAPERREGRNSEVGETSGILQGLAKELNIPILALSQLSREVERREDKVPILADLRDSGSLEQDASTVMFLYRDDYYHPDKYSGGDPSITNLIIAKNRFGPLGKIDFAFWKAKSRFALIERKREQKSTEQCI